MTAAERLELEYLRYFYEHVRSALGPADGEIYDMIAEDFENKTGKMPPKKYAPYFYEDE